MSGPSVLHVDSSHAWGGGQNQIRLLMRELMREGIDQLCICPAGSLLAQRLMDEGLPLRPVTWRGGSDPRAFLGIARAARHYDVIHCHDAHALQLAIVPARLFRKRLVAARRVRFKTNALKWNRADRVIAISNSVRDRLLASGVHEQRIEVIYSGVDIAELRGLRPLQPPVRARLGIPPDAFVIGNTAALFEAKGQTLIPAVAALLPAVHWVIAGEGPQRGVIQQAVAHYNVADRVHLLGWLDEARAMLKEVDAYVSTSVDEALGVSILEAMALQVPVVAADMGGPGEVLLPVHERTGVSLFEPGNAGALADAITKLRTRNVREAVIAAQNQRLTDFTVAQTAEQTLQLYRELIR